jgi:cell wall-associated protease
MAPPVVTGLAVLLREYYPQLNARQVKDIILKSVARSPLLKNVCNTGGVVNAYQALLLAAAYAHERF